jgi:hypothetical protein
MPRDGALVEARTTGPGTIEQEVVDRALEWFGPGGENWRPYAAGELGVGCLIQGLNAAADRLTGERGGRAGSDEAVEPGLRRVKLAVREVIGARDIGEWNDRRRSFEPVRAALLAARERVSAPTDGGGR